MMEQANYFNNSNFNVQLQSYKSCSPPRSNRQMFLEGRNPYWQRQQLASPATSVLHFSQTGLNSVASPCLSESRQQQQIIQQANSIAAQEAARLKQFFQGVVDKQRIQVEHLQKALALDQRKLLELQNTLRDEESVIQRLVEREVGKQQEKFRIAISEKVADLKQFCAMQISQQLKPSLENKQQNYNIIAQQIEQKIASLERSLAGQVKSQEEVGRLVALNVNHLRQGLDTALREGKEFYKSQFDVFAKSLQDKVGKNHIRTLFEEVVAEKTQKLQTSIEEVQHISYQLTQNTGDNIEQKFKAIEQQKSEQFQSLQDCEQRLKQRVEKLERDLGSVKFSCKCGKDFELRKLRSSLKLVTENLSTNLSKSHALFAKLKEQIAKEVSEKEQLQKQLRKKVKLQLTSAIISPKYQIREKTPKSPYRQNGDFFRSQRQSCERLNIECDQQTTPTAPKSPLQGFQQELQTDRREKSPTTITEQVFGFPLSPLQQPVARQLIRNKTAQGRGATTAAIEQIQQQQPAVEQRDVDMFSSIQSIPSSPSNKMVFEMVQDLDNLAFARSSCNTKQIQSLVPCKLVNKMSADTSKSHSAVRLPSGSTQNVTPRHGARRSEQQERSHLKVELNDFDDFLDDSQNLSCESDSDVFFYPEEEQQRRNGTQSGAFQLIIEKMDAFAANQTPVQRSLQSTQRKQPITHSPLSPLGVESSLTPPSKRQQQLQFVVQSSPKFQTVSDSLALREHLIKRRILFNSTMAMQRSNQKDRPSEQDKRLVCHWDSSGRLKDNYGKFIFDDQGFPLKFTSNELLALQEKQLIVLPRGVVAQQTAV